MKTLLMMLKWFDTSNHNEGDARPLPIAKKSNCSF